MANRYWIGGSGTWNLTDTTRWSASSGGATGASVPTSTDKAIFDSNSAAMGSYTVTVSTAVTCETLQISRFTTTSTVAFSGSGSISINGGLDIVSSAGINISTGLVFASTSAGNTIKTNGNAVTGITDFNGVGGEWTLLNSASFTNQVSLTNGTLKLDTYRLTLGTFNSSNSNTRTLDFGSAGGITVTGSGSTAFNCATSTNFTVSNPAGERIYMSSASAKTFAGGGLTWPGIWNQGSGALTITGNNTFYGTFEATAPATYLFEAGSTQTFTGSLYFVGTVANGITINSTVAGSQATLSQAAGLGFQATYVTVKDSNATGGQTWTATNSTNSGNNTGWIFGGSTGNMFQLF